MENEKNENIDSQNDELELENEELETPTGEEDNSEDNSNSDDSNNEELEELKKQNEELVNKNKQLFERLKKTNKSTKSNSFGEEDLIRLSKVASKLDDDDLEVLKTIKGESIAEKLDNPMFKAYKKDKLAQERSKASSLAPSKPGIQVQGKSFSDPSIGPEDHKKMFNELIKN